MSFRPLDVLWMAATFVESGKPGEGRLSPESDHGYASKMPTPQPSRATSSKFLAVQGAQRRKARRGHAARKQRYLATAASRALTSSTSVSNRSLHNQMEKNRRAHMRSCQNRLKELVPVGPSGRHTTQGLLIAAVRHIRNLEESFQPKQKEMEILLKEQAMLRARLESLTSMTYRESKELMARLRHGGVSPTSSESAASSSSFLSHSPSPSNYSEHIDVIGTSSGSDVSSDADEPSCWLSTSAGGRLVPSTSRLVLSDAAAVGGRW